VGSLIPRDSFYVSLDDLAEQGYCQQRALFRVLGAEAALRDEFTGSHGETPSQDQPESILLLPEETTALLAIGSKLKARTWREIFLAPPRLLSLRAFAEAARKARVKKELAKELAGKLTAARKTKSFQLLPVDENPALFRLHEAAAEGNAVAAAELQSILDAAQRKTRKGVFRFRLLRVAASAVIARTAVIEQRTVPDQDAARQQIHVARARANLAAYLFKKARWQVELRCADGSQPLADARPLDRPRALGLLKRMIAFLRKDAHPEAPHPARCIPCEFKRRCALYKTMKRWRYRG
jgi:hypothetical protein